MSDYGKLQEIEQLYNKAVDYGMIPPDWDGTPPAGARGAERHGEHKPPEPKTEGKRS